MINIHEKVMFSRLFFSFRKRERLIKILETQHGTIKQSAFALSKQNNITVDFINRKALELPWANYFLNIQRKYKINCLEF